MTGLKRYFTTLNNSKLTELLDEKIVFMNKTRNGTKCTGTYQQIMEKLESEHIFIEFDTCIEWLQTQDERVYILDGFFSNAAYGFALRKDWKHAESVRKRFVEYGRSGILDQIIRKHNPKKRETIARDSAPIQIKSFLSVVIVTGVCGLAAVLVAIVDFMRHTVHSVENGLAFVKTTIVR